MADPARAATGGGRSWWRTAAVVPPVWWTLRLTVGGSDGCVLDLVNLAFHEAGHVFLSFAGATLHVLGGTVGQLVVPAGLAGYFLRRRDPFAAALCVWWTGESLVHVATYMADARTLALPLVGGGDHDWNELFFRWGLLTEPAVRFVAGATRGVGVLVMLVGLVWAGAFVLPAARRERLRRAVSARWPWLEAVLDG